MVNVLFAMMSIWLCWELLEIDENMIIIIIIWSLEKVLRKWKRGLIIKIPKKGNLRECKNWRGVTLLSVVSKILGRIVIDRIRMGFDCRLRKEQAGFRSGRGTTEQFSSYAIY